MKKNWIVGGILLVSIALNVTLGAMLSGKYFQEHQQRVEVVMQKIVTLPEPERAKAKAVFLQAVPELRNGIREIRQARKEVRHYVASDSYSRAEAEKRLTDLRVKTTALQLAAQKMMLDIADKLPPEQRARLLEQADEGVQ
jgi:Spy/CpxP family protein refolding chaperone